MRMKIAALSFFSVVKRQPNSATCKSYKIKEELDKTNSFKHVSANTHPNCYNYNPKSKITNYEETNSVMVLYKNSDDVLCVKGNYIATLSGRHIKAYKYSLLNHYKKQLQELKRQQRGNN